MISDETITRAQAVKFQKDFDIKFPVLFDASGEIAEVLAPTNVPEAFVLDAAAKSFIAAGSTTGTRSLARNASKPRRTNWPKRSQRLPPEDDRNRATTPVGCPVEKVAGDRQHTLPRDV